MADEKRVTQPTHQPGGGKPDSGQADHTGSARVASAGQKNPLSESLRHFEDAHLNYLREVRDVCADAQQRYQQAYQQAYQQQIQAYSSLAYAEPQKRSEPSRLRAEQQESSFSPEDVQKRLEEAYRNHLRAIKDAWAKLDVDAIDFGSNS